MSALTTLTEPGNSCRVLNAEIGEIENAISHLIRSNGELAEALVRCRSWKPFWLLRYDGGARVLG
jgi:hypothetical protein